LYVLTVKLQSAARLELCNQRYNKYPHSVLARREVFWTGVHYQMPFKLEDVVSYWLNIIFC